MAEFLGEVRPAFWVSDRLAAQQGWATEGRQACWAHLQRDVQYAIAAGDDAFAPATQAGRKLQRIVKRFRQNLFVFITNRDMPPTNNGSEQALRPWVVFRKVTNCFRSGWGADLYANVRSVIETARRRSIGLLRALRITLQGQPLPAAS